MMNFIVIEGICGVGKTTISNKLANLLNGKYGKASPSNLHLGKSIKSSYQFDINLSDALYVADLIIYTQEFIKPELQKGNLIIQDKYSDSIVAYSNACCQLTGEDKYSISDQIRLLEQHKILLKPQVYFYLFSDKNMIIDRLRSSQTPIHRFYLENPKMIDFVFKEFEKILEERKKQGVEIFKIDTNNMNVDETICLIKKIILR